MNDRRHATACLDPSALEAARRRSRRRGSRTRSRPSCARAPERASEFCTIGGFPVKRIYTALDVADTPLEDIGLPGQYPFTRGPYPTMYRGRFWTMRQIAGFGTGEDTNQRFKYLIAQGQTGLSTDFDMPTLMGYDSDHPMSEGEVGREGVAIDTLADMERAVRRHRPGEDLGLDDDQSDARGSCSRCTSRSRRSAATTSTGCRARSRPTSSRNTWRRRSGSFRSRRRCASCATASPTAPRNMKRYNPINISGYHISEAGASPLARGRRSRCATSIDVRRGGAEDRHARRRVRAAARVLLRLPGRLLRGDREVPRGAARATRRS